MSCREARLRILEADRATLQGSGVSELALHLRGCAGCRSVARRVLEEERALARALDALPPRTPVEDALARWRALDRPPARPARPHKWWLPACAAAAAAGVAIALGVPWLGGPSSAPVAEAIFPFEAWVPAHAQGPPPPLVEVPDDREVAVFGTSDPDIIVVWIYQEPME